jgi:hypothetical protein
MRLDRRTPTGASVVLPKWRYFISQIPVIDMLFVYAFMKYLMYAILAGSLHRPRSEKLSVSVCVVDRNAPHSQSSRLLSAADSLSSNSNHHHQYTGTSTITLDQLRIYADA